MFDQLIKVVILGLIQGLTEWLPISSSGHLIVIEYFLGLATTPLFGIILHIGTLIVVVSFFRKEVKSILLALIHLDFKSKYGRLIPLIIAGTIPTAVIGLVYTKFLEDNLSGILPIGITFLIGATIVYASKLGNENRDSITYPMVLLMGTAQGFAAFHGLSRSGATISIALLLGLRREKAFKVSFLLSIPAILGDFLVEFYKERGQIVFSVLGWGDLLVGVAVAMIVGYTTLKLLSKIVASRRFHYFAFYTWLLGATIIILTLSGF